MNRDIRNSVSSCQARVQHCSICMCILSHTTRVWWVACLASSDARGIVYSSLMPCRMRRCLLYAPMDSWAARSLKRSHARRAECLTTRAFRRGRRHRIQQLRPYILLVAHSSATSAGLFPPLALHPCLPGSASCVVVANVYCYACDRKRLKPMNRQCGGERPFLYIHSKQTPNFRDNDTHMQ